MNDEGLPPRQFFWETSISKVERNRILVRGYPIDDLIGSRSFGDVVYLVFTGELPPGREGELIEAILVSSVDHGLHAPSATAARFVASCGVPLQAAVASAINAIGEIHGGAIEASARLLQESIRETAGSPSETAERILARSRENEVKLPGFGHPIHDKDPRTRKLFELAQELGHYGPHAELTLAISELSPQYFRKKLTVNVDGAIAAIISDLAIPWQYGKGFFIVARCVGLIAHVFEEMTECRPFRQVSLDEVRYTGKPLRNLKDKQSCPGGE